MNKLLAKHQRELAVALAYLALLLLVAVVSPAFFNPGNLRDLALSNAAVLLVAVGMTCVILAGQIDISVGAQFAVCSVAAGLLAKAGLPLPLLFIVLLLVGAVLGTVNGALVAWVRIPAIVVTLATLAAWRDGLRWLTEGAWVQGLPPNFQWFGLGQTFGQWLIVLLALLVWFVGAWALQNLAAGRAVYAVGCDEEAARLAGINPQRVVFSVFTLLGALTGAAALLNSIRFSDIQSNAGVGLELKAIAAVVVGGTAITGGRGTLVGTLAGVALLGTIGTALTFAGINPFWEKALQGAIILAAVFADAALVRLGHARVEAAAR